MQQYANSFRKLVAWQSAKKLALLIYELTKKFPREEIFGLTSQMRRSAVSVPANLAEGNEKPSRKERVHFFGIARTSLAELDCLSEFALEQKYLTEKEYKEILELINKTAFLIYKLIQALKNRDS